jgi:hypothetical protein
LTESVGLQIIRVDSLRSTISPPHIVHLSGSELGRQATSSDMQSLPIAVVPGMRPVPVPTGPVYSPSGIAPLIADDQGLPQRTYGSGQAQRRGSDWQEQQRAKERGDVVVKDI